MNFLRPRASPVPLPLLSRLLAVGHGGARRAVAPGCVARYASTEAVAAAATTPPPTAPTIPPVPATPAPAAEATQKQARRGGRPQQRDPNPPGHGERLWVWNHIRENYIVYSLTPEMRSTKVFRQFAYTGKKLVPPKLRRDYWRLLAVVEFGAGKGDVGRSAFQKLRELLRRHQLEWDREYHDGRDGGTDVGAELLRMSRRERGRALNDQRGNAVADLAAVLAGRGKGNKVVFEDEEAEISKLGLERWLMKKKLRNKRLGPVANVVDVEVEENEAAKRTMATNEGDRLAGGSGKRTVKLHQATVYWANEQDKFYALSWSKNVVHVLGLPEKQAKAEDAVESGSAEGQAEAA